MNKIDMNAVLPKAPAPATKARSGNLFQEELGLGKNTAGLATADAGLPLPEDGGRSDGHLRKQSMVCRDIELYSLAALAQNHLSYARDLEAPEPVCPAGVTASVQPVQEEIFHSASSQAPRQTYHGNALHLQAGPTSASTATAAGEEGEVAVSATGAMAMPQELSARYPRRVSLVKAASGGIEAVVRDYEGDSGELLAQIQLHCSNHDISLTRIVLNGTVLWSKPSAN